MAVAWGFQPTLRSSSPALATLRQVGANLDPTRPMLLWALLYLLAGACLLAAQSGMVVPGWLGFEIGAAVTAFYAGCLLVSVSRSSSQSFSGPIAFGAIALLHVVGALNQRR